MVVLVLVRIEVVLPRPPAVATGRGRVNRMTAVARKEAKDKPPRSV